jgi:hypothetical protein
MLARVGRLERTDALAPSPFEREYGSLDNLASAWRAMMEAGTLDRRDGEALITIMIRWHTDRVWDPLR